jgi:hypothetical protein
LVYDGKLRHWFLLWVASACHEATLVEPNFRPGNPGELHDILQGNRRCVSRFTSSAISRCREKNWEFFENRLGVGAS